MKKSIFIWGALCGAAFAAVWSEPKLIGHDAGHHLAIDNQGVCWATGAPTFYRYDEETSSWQSLGKIPSSVWGSSIPVGYFDKGDTLWVFNGNFYDIYYVRYDGQTWSDVDTVPAFPYENSPPLVTLDSTGTLWAVWSLMLPLQVAYNRYEDGAWGEPETVLDTMPGEDELWTVTTDAQGRVWAGWCNVGSGGNSLECRYNDDGVWSEQLSIRGTDSLYAKYLAFAPDREGGIWAVWDVVRYDWRNNPYFVEVRHYKDGEWGDIDTVANAGIFLDYGSHPMPRITVDAYGRAWAVWRQAVLPKDAYCDIYYSFNSGKGWSEPKPVDTNPAVDQLPDIAVDGAGRVRCVWSSNREGEDEWDYGAWASYTVSTGVEEEENNQPPKSAIECISPNPFRSSAVISYSVGGNRGSKETKHVKLNVIDITGREVRVLASEEYIPGHYTVIWDGRDRNGLSLPSGVYFVRICSDEFEANERVVLLK